MRTRAGHWLVLLAACNVDAPAATRPGAQAAVPAAAKLEAAPAREGPVCPASGEACRPTAPSATVEPDGAELFGSAFDPGVPEVSLTALLAEPARYSGQKVETSGTVSRVCLKAGCWMELRDEVGGTVRAPMAGHAFSLPQRAVDRLARVQGTVQLRPLTEAQKEHLRAEGARATEASLSLVASSVRVSAPGGTQAPAN
jgi:hypothetical protein